jgi:hypothetical protein
MQRFWALHQECGGDIGETRKRFMEEVVTAFEKGVDRSMVTDKALSMRKARARELTRQNLARVLPEPAHERLKLPLSLPVPKRGFTASLNKGSILQEPSRFISRLETLRSEDKATAIDTLLHEAWLESQGGTCPDPEGADIRTLNNIRKRQSRFRIAAIRHMSHEIDLMVVDGDDTSHAEIRAELYRRLIAAADRFQ